MSQMFWLEDFDLKKWPKSKIFEPTKAVQFQRFKYFLIKRRQEALLI